MIKNLKVGDRVKGVDFIGRSFTGVVRKFDGDGDACLDRENNPNENKYWYCCKINGVWLSDTEDCTPLELIAEPKFKVGDRVVVVEGNDHSKEGAVGTVKELDHVPAIMYDEGERWCTCETRLELYTLDSGAALTSEKLDSAIDTLSNKVIEDKEEEYKFKKGDEVVVINGGEFEGKIGIVQEDDVTPYVLLRNGERWAFDEDDLGLYSEEGDRHPLFAVDHTSKEDEVKECGERLGRGIFDVSHTPEPSMTWSTMYCSANDSVSIPVTKPRTVEEVLSRVNNLLN